MNFSLPQTNMSMVFLSIALFIAVGFLFPSTSSTNQTAREKYAESSAEYYSNKSLKEINFASLDLKDYITQGYGYTSFAAVHGGHIGGRHNGIDIAANYGAEILSESDGEVVYIGNQDQYCPGRGYGKFVMVRNRDDGYTLLYSHLSKVKTELGDQLKKGEVLGLIGTTGLTTGPHLHFVVFKTDSLKMKKDKKCGPKPEGTDVNPIKYLDL